MQLDEYQSDDFLFPMTILLSYASSPESDTDAGLAQSLLSLQFRRFRNAFQTGLRLQSFVERAAAQRTQRQLDVRPQRRVTAPSTAEVT